MKYTKAIAAMGMVLCLYMTGCQSIEDNGKEAGETPGDTGVVTSAETPAETSVETPAETPAETLTPTETPSESDMQMIEVSKELISSDGAYRIKIPQNWEDMQDQLNQPFTIEAGSMDEGAFFMVNGENKSGNALKNLEQYTNALVGYVAGTLPQSQSGERVQSEVDGKNAYKQKLTGLVQDVNTVYWVYTIDGTSQFIQINAWASAEKADRAELFFDQIVNSYRESS